MIKLISPEYDLAAFCSQMIGRELLDIMQQASAEISYAKRLHRDQTKDTDFRKGSRGRKYCDSLQTLIRLLMGTPPANPTPEFNRAVAQRLQESLVLHVRFA